jgi:TolA-binding protein
VTQNENMLQEIAKLRGQIEVLANDIANAQKRQKDFYVDLDARLRKLEPREVTIDGKTAQVDPGEQRGYEAAMQLFKAGDYKAAGGPLQRLRAALSGFELRGQRAILAGQRLPRSATARPPSRPSWWC